ncbi:metallophosphoesterase [Paenibacillus sp. sgz500958]|uniref:metallophosphoesterase n=1 Tax=Paenibacillus sp. sgz500958 TaxID=3242475 RepID=UPI0036D37F84
MTASRHVISGLLLLMIVTGCTNAQSTSPEFQIQSGKELKLLVTSDTHYLAKSLNDGGPAFQKFSSGGDSKQRSYSDELMSALELDVSLQKPDITIISGDLTNNGEKQSHLDMADHLKDIEKNSGTRVYVIPGNHDISNPWARRFKGERQYITDTVTPKDFKKIYSAFGYAEALSRDSQSLSYLAAPSEELWLLMLDTSQYSYNGELGHPQLDGRLYPETLRWIDECGERARQNGAELVAVMHHNLTDHSELIQEGFTINNSQAVADVLMRNGVHTVFSGHIHIQDIAYVQKETGRIYDIASSALSVFPHQFGILNYSKFNHTMDYSTARLNVEQWAKTSGNKDPHLLNFNAYSEETFGEASFERSYQHLSEDMSYSGYSEEQLQAMAEVVMRLNENYFAGSENTDNAAVLASEGYRLWKDSPASGLKSYVERMAERGNKNNRHLHVELP